MNRLVIAARIVALQAQRYTPAGLQALNFSLEHESQQEEAGQIRQVKAGIEAVAIGELAVRISACPVGSAGRFSGFLAQARQGRQVRFHVQEFQPD